MRLASYHGTRSGIMGLGNIAIRLRLRGRYSHSEIVFEPGDGVDSLMPDGTCEPDADGALWCVSSTGLERLPAWSPRRAGRMGGVRFKRIVLKPAKWTLDPVQADPLYAAHWADENQGVPYDWQLILGFVSWLIPNKRSRVMCSEACAVNVLQSGTNVTLNLPASPAVGTWVIVIDKSAGEGNLTIGRNSQNIMGLAENLVFDTPPQQSVLFYFTTGGWTLIG